MLASPAPLDAIAARQHGVVTLEQLIGCGIPRSTIGFRARSGRLHRLHRTVYSVVAPQMLTREGRYLAAVLAGGRLAVLSHTPSARILGLDRTRGVGAIHISVPRDARPSIAGVIVHRPRHLERIDIVHRFGIPTTAAARTLLDQTPHLSPAQLRSQFERAEYLEILDRPRLNALLATESRRKGLASLRKLAGYEPLPLSRIRSRLEGIVLTTCRTHSLPLPAVNVPLLGYEIDFLWEGAKLVVEADGGQHRGEQRDSDNARDLALQRAGYLVRRYSEEALERPEEVAREIRELLSERWSSAGSASR